MKNVFLLSLGCPRNLVDSEVMRGALRDKGFVLVDDADDADVAVVNTCGFIEDAKSESIEYVLRLAELRISGRIERLIVTGCLAQRYPEELFEAMEEVDAFFGVDEIFRIGEYLSCTEHPGRRKAQAARPSFLYDHDSPRELLTPSHYAYVKIQEGCSQGCSYCVIPSIKGKSRSRSVTSVVEEVKCLIERNGVKEVVLIGQDTTSFGSDTGDETGLAGLLEILTGRFQDTWFRLLYTHPENFNDELIRLFEKRANLLSYIDMPIQHINPRILALMGRRASSEGIRSLLQELRGRVSGLVLRTSVICGFPTETEEEFNELLGFLGQVRFERLGAFRYSPEEGTLAAKLPGQVCESVKEERFAAIMEQQRSISMELNQELIGRSLEVLIDEVDPSGSRIGRSYMDAPEVDGVIYVNNAPDAATGDIVHVTVTGAQEYDLEGEESREPAQ